MVDRFISWLAQKRGLSVINADDRIARLEQRVAELEKRPAPIPTGGGSPAAFAALLDEWLNGGTHGEQ